MQQIGENVCQISNFREISIKICFLVKLTFAYYNNLMFNLKIFEEVLSHLHGNYEQDI